MFGPKAFAGIGRLTGALASRTIPIWLYPRLATETIRDKFEEDLWSETEGLRRDLATWGAASIERLRSTREVDLPGGLVNRTREIWRPLLAIADMAGEQWPKKARAAALALHEGHSDELHYKVRLLADIRDVFDQRTADRLHTADLIQALVNIEESRWRGWWWDDFNNKPKSDAASSLAKILQDYGIRPVEGFQIGQVRARGYRRNLFEDAWSRYLPTQLAVYPVSPVQSDPSSQSDAHGQHGQHRDGRQAGTEPSDPHRSKPMRLTSSRCWIDNHPAGTRSWINPPIPTKPGSPGSPTPLIRGGP